MARKQTPSKRGQSKSARKRYSEEFKREALALEERVGAAGAAKELGLHDSQLYAWRSKARLSQDLQEVERSQATEIARLKRLLAQREEELAIVKKAAAYFAKGLKFGGEPLGILFMQMYYLAGSEHGSVKKQRSVLCALTHLIKQ